MEERSPLAFDLAKSLIESVCKTILNDRGKRIEESWDTQVLLRETLLNLRLLPENHPDTKAGRDRLVKIVRGLQQAVQGLCEVRNNEGLASHGKDAYEEPLDWVQIELAGRAADAVVHFLYMCHQQYKRDPNVGRLRYGEEEDFDNYCDELHGPLRIFDLEYRASEVLFAMDPIGYRDRLVEYRAIPADQDP